MSSMPTEDRLGELLLRWDDLRRQGRDVSAGELCPDCPELADKLRRRIEILRGMEPVLELETSRLVPAPGDGGSDGLGTDRRLPDNLYATTVYRPWRYHAQGGLGEVLAAHQEELDRTVALKRIRPDRLHDAARRRFLREAAITARLQHPGIVPIYGLGHDPDGPFYTMPFIEGQTLQEAINAFHGDEASGRDPGRRGLAFHGLLQRFIAVCNTMAYAHDQGVIHRDLKPSNIMLGPYGETLVMDWGLAKRLGADDSGESEGDALSTSPWPDALTATGAVMGTPHYMSPEQARGEVEWLDERCDVFALGSILCEILTGRPAYTGRSPEEIGRRAERADLSEARARLDSCGADADLIALAHDCLAVGLNDRARDAGVVSSRLSAYTESLQERIRQAELGRAAEQARAEEARRTAAEAEAKALAERRARRLTAALAASVLALTAVGIAGFSWTARQRRERVERGGVLVAKAEAEYLQALRDPESAPGAWQRVGGILDQAEEFLRGATDLGMNTRITSLRDRARVEAERSDGARRRAERLSELAENYWDGDLNRYDRPEEVVRLLRSALEIRPKDHLAHNNLGLALRAKGDVDGAIAAHREAIRLKPGETLYHTDLGRALGAKGDVDGSIAAHREAIRLNPEDPDCHDDLGDALWAKGDTDGAIAAYREAIRLKPHSPFYHNNLGYGLRRKGDLAGATAASREAIRLKPDYADAHRNLGLTLEAKGDSDGAIAEYREAIRLKPGEALYHNNLGGALRAKRDLGGAITEHREAIRLKPDFPDAHNNLGRALRDKEDVGGAIAEYREAIRLKPGEPAYHDNLGVALRAKGDLGGAIAAHREAIRLKPDYPNAHCNLGVALRDKGDVGGAIAEYREAIRFKPNYDGAHCNLGNALRDNKGDADGAIVEYREAIRLKPGEALYHSNLSLALRDKGDLRGAIAACREAIRLKPDYADAHRNLGHALRDKGDVGGAIAEYREAIRLKPDYADAHNGIAWAMAKQPDPDSRGITEALEHARKAVALGPTTAYCYGTLALTEYRAGHLAESIAAAERALELDKTGKLIAYRWFYLAMAQSRRGETDQARGYFDRAVAWTREHDPRNVDLLQFWAEAAALLGRPGPDLADPARLPGLPADVFAP
jgi:tetratricopeptide (TPR) repeat protein/tRNA A-37 threonylcarbamoyl transferase component Bud32